MVHLKKTEVRYMVWTIWGRRRSTETVWSVGVSTHVKTATLKLNKKVWLVLSLSHQCAGVLWGFTMILKTINHHTHNPLQRCLCIKRQKCKNNCQERIFFFFSIKLYIYFCIILPLQTPKNVEIKLSDELLSLSLLPWRNHRL